MDTGQPQVAEEDRAGRWVPPYISFRTITDLLKRMEEEEPPSRIDKSYLHTYSGGYQTQVIAALNALGLRDERTGDVSEVLTDLVTADEAERKRIVGKVLEQHYGPVLALDRNATQGQLLEAFKGMGVNSGDTMRKVVAFFLSAAKYAGVPVSKHWRTPPVPRSTRRRSGAAGQGGPSDEPRGDTESTGSAGDGGTAGAGAVPSNLRSLQLRSGGTVTLGLSVDLFSLDDEDQKFVRDLVGKVKEYGKQRELPPGGAVVPTAPTQDEGMEEEAEDG